ncbi:MAG: FtsX-like permease family protein [Planctomycetaceae bacterium]|nr:FtsX-like permease family protein [Planctomycetaceae bacterium]
MTQIPLAWNNLTYDLRRLVVAVSGIAFAVVLMFQQRGFQHALFDSTVEIVRQFDCDFVLLHPSRFALSVETRFDRSLIDVAASQPGIVSVSPLYVENLAARLQRENQKARPIRVLAFDLDRPVLLDRAQEFSSQRGALRAPATAIMDRLSRSDYGFELGAGSKFPQAGELNGHTLQIVGTFTSGRDFAHTGNLIMSQENFAGYFAHRGSRPLEQVDLGLVKTDPKLDRAKIEADLRRALGNEVSILTREALIEREIALWDRSTPIGVIFTVGTLMGFVVGVIICYQVLATAIADHIGEFATLKAMGYSNLYFVRLTIEQSIYLAGLGFIPGAGLSWVLFQFNASFTALPMLMTIDRVLVVLLATVAMCVLSGILALRKLFAADPASLF